MKCIICLEIIENDKNFKIVSCNCNYDCHYECISKCSNCLYCRNKLNIINERDKAFRDVLENIDDLYALYDIWFYIKHVDYYKYYYNIRGKMNSKKDVKNSLLKFYNESKDIVKSKVVNYMIMIGYKFYGFLPEDINCS